MIFALTLEIPAPGTRLIAGEFLLWRLGRAMVEMCHNFSTKYLFLYFLNFSSNEAFTLHLDRLFINKVFLQCS